MFVADPAERTAANFTLAGVERMAAALGGRRVNCKLTSRLQTRIFEFPSVTLAEGISVEELLHKECDFTATLVSDPVSHLEKSASRHYSLDPTLRSKVGELLERKAPNRPLFVVTEHFGPIASLALTKGECFEHDEKWIEGGTPGNAALTAFRTSDGAWPDDEPFSPQSTNLVLAAIKVSKDVTHSFVPLVDCWCYILSDGRAVHSLFPSLSARGVLLAPCRDPEKMADTLRDTIRFLQENSAAHAGVEALITALRLRTTEDIHYLTLWYLSLWEAATQAAPHLGVPQFGNPGNLGTKRAGLRDHRNDIAHGRTSRVAPSCLVDLQGEVHRLLRRCAERSRPERAERE